MAFGELDEIMDIHGNKHSITPAPLVYEGFIPSSVIYNYFDYYDSCNRLVALMEHFSPDYLIAGHEPALLFENDERPFVHGK